MIAPKSLIDKNLIGDWKIDTVIDKNHLGSIVTVVERKALFTVAAIVDCKKADVVKAETINITEGRAHTIKTNNGKQFSYHDKLVE
jgi:IS30 family transposase